jgi:hypothetical protein
MTLTRTVYRKKHLRGHDHSLQHIEIARSTGKYTIIISHIMNIGLHLQYCDGLPKDQRAGDSEAVGQWVDQQKSRHPTVKIQTMRSTGRRLGSSETVSRAAKVPPPDRHKIDGSVNGPATRNLKSNSGNLRCIHAFFLTFIDPNDAGHRRRQY